MSDFQDSIRIVKIFQKCLVKELKKDQNLVLVALQVWFNNKIN